MTCAALTLMFPTLGAGAVAQDTPTTAAGLVVSPQVSFDPVRVFDSRGGARLEPGSIVPIDVTDVVPAGATAAVVQLTATDAEATWISISARPLPDPEVSQLNVGAGETRANAAVVAVGPERTIHATIGNGATHLIVDVTGLMPEGFAPTKPTRVLDTRRPDVPAGPSAGGTRAVRVAGVAGVPFDAAAVVAQITAVDATSATYVTVHPFGDRVPTASNLNLTVGATRANLVVVRPGADGRIGVFNEAGSFDLLVDVFGYFAADGVFTAIEAARLVDTRVGAPRIDAVSTSHGRLEPWEVLEIPVGGRAGVPTSARLAVLNVTVTDASAAGFVSVVPCRSTPGAAPGTSTVNFATREVVAAATLVPLGVGSAVCAVSSASVELIVDVSGFIAADTGAFGTNGIIVNSRPAHMDFDAIEPWIDGIGYLRVWGGARGMATYPTEDAVPEFLRDRPRHVDVVTQGQIDAIVAMQRRHGLRIVYMVNVNDTLANQTAFVERLFAAGVDVAMLELGNELYLPKFRDGDTSQLGVTRAWTVEDYVGMLRTWSPALRSFGVPLYGIGASHDPGDRPRDAYRRTWNEVLHAAMRDDPTLLDGVTFHLYVGIERNGIDPEEHLTDERLDFLDSFEGFPVAITEAGHQFSEVTPENLARSVAFWDLLSSRLGPGDVFGLHVLYNDHGRPSATGYTLFDQNGRTVVGDLLADWLARRR